MIMKLFFKLKFRKEFCSQERYISLYYFKEISYEKYVAVLEYFIKYMLRNLLYVALLSDIIKNCSTQYNIK